MKKITLILILLFVFAGCSTISRVTDLKGQPPVTDLFPDDEDIAKIVDEVKSRPAVKSRIKHTPQGYLVPPDIYERMLTEKIYLMALKAKVKAFSKNYDPETLIEAFRQDMGTVTLTLLLLLGLTLY